jgi:hypothetical protein
LRGGLHSLDSPSGAGECAPPPGALLLAFSMAFNKAECTD